MEGCVTENHSVLEDSENATNPNTAENFQKFIYDLFEKNGVINDLRAYLRGHIVNVLKNVEAGNVPSCQKHFTQRLDLQFQAINILIAEYLLNMEFSYSTSVFLSEIPLANMVIDFAQSLLQVAPDGDVTGLRFKDTDVWSIFNYLGIKCDSENALQIMQLYKSGETPSLLLSIFKGASMCHKSTVHFDNAVESEDCTSSFNSLDDKEERSERSYNGKRAYHDKCRHYGVCATCQNKVSKLKEKHKKKKNILLKNVQSDVNPNNVERLLKNIHLVEGNLMNEMFEQLRSVYETEVEMIRGEERKNVEQKLISHKMEFNKRRVELEDLLKTREEQIESNAQKKKEFLWGVALALRRQQRRLAQEMRAVREQARKLAEKEENLKMRYSEAEKSLRQRGEVMRVEISKELNILERQSKAMKREREAVSKERLELEKIRDTNSENRLAATEDLRQRYEMLKSEFNLLKMYVECGRMAKFGVDKGVGTETRDVDYKLLNNEQNKNSMKTVVNDLKHKIVNFNQTNTTEYRPGKAEVHSAIEADRSRYYTDTIKKLREDNERLREFAALQTAHVAALHPPRDYSAGQIYQLKEGARSSSPRQKERRRPVSAGAVMDHEPKTTAHVHERVTFEIPRVNSRKTRSDRQRETSPDFKLRETKEKLRIVRRQSPLGAVQEATRRARTLQREETRLDHRYRRLQRRAAQPDVHRTDLVMDLGPRYSRPLDPKPTNYESLLPISSKLDEAAVKNDFDKYINNYTDHYPRDIQLNNKSLTRKMNPITSFTEEIIKENYFKENLLEKPLAEFRKLYYSQKYRKPNIIERNMNVKYERKSSNESKNVDLESNSSENYKSSNSIKLEDDKKDLENSEQNLNNFSDIQYREIADDNNIDDAVEDATNEAVVEEKNLLRIEVEINKTNNKDIEDIAVIVESSLDEQIYNEQIIKKEKCENTTVIISRSSPTRVHESVSENSELSKNNVVYQDSNATYKVAKALSGVGVELIQNNDNVNEYGDDFSADVDNYNSRSDFENRSPISLLKTSEDEFWDD